MTLWQLLDDWMVLLDTDSEDKDADVLNAAHQRRLNNAHSNLHPAPTDTQTTAATESSFSAGTDAEPSKQMATETKTNAEPLKQMVTDTKTDSSATAMGKLSKPPGEDSVTQTKLICPGDAAPAMPSASKTRGGVQCEKSPAIPRICALIQAFYLCTQNFKEKKWVLR